jgi:hypothetical protein
MFKSKTVFVVGAGASEEAGLPIGKELTGEISSLLHISSRPDGSLERGDQDIREAIRRLGAQQSDKWDTNKLIRSGRQVSAAMGLAPSIDTFLQSHCGNDEYVLLGKMGIAKAIILAELRSKLARNQGRSQPFEMATVHGTWFVSLAQQLFSEVPAAQPELAFKNVSFIIFNYDRCLQVFLTRALELYFQIDHQRARAIVAKVDIVHPYGNLGDMNESDHTLPMFGDTQCDLYAVSQRLKTFSESEIDVDKSTKIEDSMRKAETLIFLGFAFYDQNMELLGEDVTKGDAKARYKNINRVYATTLGMSNPDVAVAKAQIGLLVRGRPPKEKDDFSIETFSGKCHELFAEYWKSLTASSPVRESGQN